MLILWPQGKVKVRESGYKMAEVNDAGNKKKLVE